MRAARHAAPVQRVLRPVMAMLANATARHLTRRLIVDGRVAAPGACADRLTGDNDWTLRLTLVAARIGHAQLGEPLVLHRRCTPSDLQELLVALAPATRLVARIEPDRGPRMRARLCEVLRIEPAADAP